MNVTASNPVPIIAGFSTNDIVVVTFTRPVLPPANVSSAIQFVPSIGPTKTTWSANSVVVTVVNASAVANASLVDVALGLLRCVVVGVMSADGLSQASTAVTLTVGGTWGAPSAPAILHAIAMDTGHNVGFGTNDSLVLVFDQSVMKLPVGNTSSVLQLLRFSPPLSSYGSVSCWGSWSSDGVSLTIVFQVLMAASPSPTAWLAWNVGSMTVSTLPSAVLKSANGESPVSNFTAVVSEGSWGDATVGVLIGKSAVAAQIVLSPPVTAVSYTPMLYVVEWDVDAGFVHVPRPTTVNEVVSATNGTAAGALSHGNVTGSDGMTIVGTMVSVHGAVNGSGVALLQLTSALASTVTVTMTGLQTGVNTYFVVTCAVDSMLLGPLVATSPAVLSPLPPYIETVSLLGSTLPTVGGVRVSVTGSQLGVVGSVVTFTLVNDVYSFTSTSCSIVTPSMAVTCVSPAGVGRGFRSVVTVDGVSSVAYDSVLLSYSLPTIDSLTLRDDATGASTAGGSVVLIRGSNFGPLITPSPLGAVSFVSADVNAVFDATSCFMSVSHVELTCEMGAGVGSRLLWTVTIANQTSTNPRTSYREPVIDSMGVLLSNGSVTSAEAHLTELATSGGDTMVFYGNYFGPVDPNLVSKAVGVSVTDGGDDNLNVVSTECQPVGDGHVEVHCVVPPGVGFGFHWYLVVAGRATSLSEQWTSYAGPVVASVTVVGGSRLVPTAGGATIAVQGQHFGPWAASVTLTWNGDTIPVTAVVNDVTLLFPAPAGQGARVDLAVQVGGQAAVVSQSYQPLRYDDPVVARLSLRRDASPVLDCSIVDSNGRPVTQSSGSTRSAVVVLEGRNFGRGDATTVTINGAVCVPLTVSDAVIVCTTQQCSGMRSGCAA